MRNTIMTEKIARRGVRVPAEYEADFLDRLLVRDLASRTLVTLRADQTVADVRAWIASHAPGSSHQGFPVLDERGALHSIVTRRSLLDPTVPIEATLSSLARRPPIVVHDTNTLREAADHMVRHGIGRLPVIERSSGKLVAIVTRSDLLGAHSQRLAHEADARRFLSWRSLVRPDAPRPR
jgi:CBS domain-containing protein